MRTTVSDRIYEGLFAPVPIAEIMPGTPMLEIRPGDPWDGAKPLDVPLDPQAAFLIDAPTATPDLVGWQLGGALVGPGNGLVMAHRPRRILAESTNIGPGRTVSFRQMSRLRPSTVSGTASLLFSTSRGHYHSPVDSIARLCVLGLPPLAERTVDVLYAGPLSPVEQLLLDRLAPANVRLRRLDSGDLVRVEELLLPSFPAWRFSGWLPSWYLTELRAALLPEREPRRSGRIFITRRGRRRILNEGEVVRRLSRHGFVPVDLEDLSFEEQIDLFYDAEVVVGAHGAGLTNMLFSQDALLVEIFPTGFVFPHYLLLGVPLGNRYRFVLGNCPTRYEDFEIDPGAVEDEVVAGLQS